MIKQQIQIDFGEDKDFSEIGITLGVLQKNPMSTVISFCELPQKIKKGTGNFKKIFFPEEKLKYQTSLIFYNEESIDSVIQILEKAKELMRKQVKNNGKIKKNTDEIIKEYTITYGYEK